MNWKRSSSPLAKKGEPARVPADVVDRKTLAEWLVRTCEAFGAKLSTAHQVAGLFVAQLEKDDAEGSNDI